MIPLIIYHGGCADGFGSAWWLGRHLGVHEKYAANYQTPPPLELIEGREVYMLDFCYPADQLAGVMKAARKLVLLDHHETAAKVMVEMGLHSSGGTNAETAAWTHEMEFHALVVDQEHSGVGLTGQYVEARWGVKAPQFLANIEDRDLWRFERAFTRDVFAVVTSHPYTEAAWDEMLRRSEESWAGFVADGMAINRYRDQLIDSVAATGVDIAVGALIVRCASAPYMIGSDVAGKIAEDAPHGVGAYMIAHPEHVQIGLRARSRNAEDVEQLAALYGGGGHKAASGFTVPWWQFEAMRQLVVDHRVRPEREFGSAAQ